MIGDDDIGIRAGARGMFDEAFAVMRATGIDALAAPVGQRGGTIAPEQRDQPAGQIAADHIAIPGERGPARDQLRQHGCTPLKAALQRVLQIEQAEIVFAALAHHHLLTEKGRIGIEPLRFADQLTLQILGVGTDPDSAAGLGGPARGGRKIAQRLADTGPRLGKQHVGLALHGARIERLGRLHRVSPLALAPFRAVAGKIVQAFQRFILIDPHLFRLRTRGPFLPFG